MQKASPSSALYSVSMQPNGTAHSTNETCSLFQLTPPAAYHFNLHVPLYYTRNGNNHGESGIMENGSVQSPDLTRRVSSDAGSASSGGPKLLNFFAQQSHLGHPPQQNASQSASPPPVSSVPLPLASLNCHVGQIPTDTSSIPPAGDAARPTQSLPSVDTTVRLNPDQPPPANNNTTFSLPRRCKDLLLHVFRGRTIFETANGLEPTEKQLAYIDAYYNGQNGNINLDAFLAEPDPGDSDLDEDPSFPESLRLCPVCRVKKPDADWASLTAKRCRACSEPPVKEKAPLQSVPIVPVTGVADVMPQPPRKVGRPRKKPKDLSFRDSTSQSVATPIPPSRRPVMFLMDQPKRKRRKRVMAPASEADQPALGVSDQDADAKRVAPLIVLLKKKPKIATWKVGHVATFLSCIRGMTDYVGVFADRQVDGARLWSMCHLDEDEAADDLPLSGDLEAMKLPGCLAWKVVCLVRLIVEEADPLSERFLTAL